MEQKSNPSNGLKNQIREAYGKVVYTYTTHLKQAQIYTVRNSIVQWFLIGFSAVSTAGLLGIIFQFWPLALSIVTACFTAVSLALNLYSKGAQLGEKAEKHRNIANSLWILREEYLSLLTDYEIMDENEIRSKRDDLTERVDAVYKNAPLTSTRAYKAAQNALKNEEEQYFSTEDINKLLPSHLRKK